MKQSFLFLLVAISTLASAINKDTTLMTIGGKEISLGEFEYLHKKNNQVVSEDENTLSEYVDLFVNFKLKVIEAEETGLDTVSSFVKELAGYRDQLAEPYLKDQNLDEQLIKEAYERLKEEVEASHILIKLEGDIPTDTLKAYNKAMEARAKVIAGEDFANVAKEYSEDPSAVSNGGHLGFFTGFQMVLPFEEAAFNTPIKGISMPVRSRFGYHIIKVHNRRPSSGEVNISHILILSNEQMSNEERAKKKAKAFSIYDEIQEGGDFEKLAEENSEDHGSASRGGNIGNIKRGQTIPPFEEVAFSMTVIGEISKPVQTRFGWHIIRFEGKKDLPSYDDKKADIKRRLARDERGTKPEKIFIANLKREYNYTIDSDNLEALYARVKDQKMDSTLKAELEMMTAPIMSFGDTMQTQADFAKYCISKKANGTDFELQFTEYEKTTMLDYEKSRLEDKYPDFKYLINEYHDGLLLFEISNQKVWGLASKDEEGLAKFHKKNKKKYKFTDTSFGGTIVYYKDSSALNTYDTLLTSLTEKEARDSLNKKSLIIKSEKGFFTIGENAIVDYYAFNKGDKPTSTYEIIKTNGKFYEAEDVKPLDATRGAAISDYQNYLEEKWIKKLRRKYKVKINDEILESLEQ